VIIDDRLEWVGDFALGDCDADTPGVVVEKLPGGGAETWGPGEE
jgi:hypothetical protein